MDILECEAFGTDDLLAAIKKTKLRGFDQAEIYADATLSLVQGVDPETLAPAQRYVLAPGVRRTLDLREALLKHGVDIFALKGGVWVRTSEHPEERIPVIPPIIEESLEPDGRKVLLVNDGMHRVYAARQSGSPISVVIARNVPAHYPYYAFALDGGWRSVQELEALPNDFEKKNYRNPENYKALFRDFNAQFPGVQKQRAQTNPEHLRA